MVAVIVGSTGLTGSVLMSKLLADGDIERVVAVSRRPLGDRNAKLQEVVVSDLAQLSLKRDELRGDIYFCCLGTTIKTAGSQQGFRKIDHDAVLAFGDIAKAHDAKSFTVVSASGANASSMIFYNRVKGETENGLIGLDLNCLNIFRPALLVGARSEVRPAEKLALNTLAILSPILPSSFKHRIATDVDDLADAMRIAGKKMERGHRFFEAVAI